MKTFFSSADRSRTIDALARRARRERARGNGLYLGHDAHGWHYADAQHSVLVLGPPRSGKTSALLIPNVLSAPGAVVTTSTKPDVLDATSATRSSLGTCHLFDPSGSVADRPGVHRLRWSPLPACTSWRTALVTARSLVVVGSRAPARAAAPRRPTGPSGPRRCWHRCCTPPRSRAPTCAPCWPGWTAGGPCPAQQALRVRPATTAHRPGPPRRDRHHRRARAQRHLVDRVGRARRLPVGAGAGRHVRSRFRPRRLRPARGTPSTSPPRPTTRRWWHRSSWACSTTSGAPPTPVPPADAGPAAPPVVLALDELANIAPLPELPSMVSEGGGQGLVTLACFQDLSQARHRWPGQADGFPSLFGTTVVLPGIGDVRTLEALSVLAGDHEVWPGRSSAGPVSTGRPLADLLGARTDPDGRAAVDAVAPPARPRRHHPRSSRLRPGLRRHATSRPGSPWHRPTWPNPGGVLRAPERALDGPGRAGRRPQHRRIRGRARPLRTRSSAIGRAVARPGMSEGIGRSTPGVADRPSPTPRSGRSGPGPSAARTTSPGSDRSATTSSDGAPWPPRSPRPRPVGSPSPAPRTAATRSVDSPDRPLRGGVGDRRHEVPGRHPGPGRHRCSSPASSPARSIAARFRRRTARPTTRTRSLDVEARPPAARRRHADPQLVDGHAPGPCPGRSAMERPPAGHPGTSAPPATGGTTRRSTPHAARTAGTARDRRRPPPTRPDRAPAPRHAGGPGEVVAERGVVDRPGWPGGGGTAAGCRAPTTARRHPGRRWPSPGGCGGGGRGPDWSDGRTRPPRPRWWPGGGPRPTASGAPRDRGARGRRRRRPPPPGVRHRRAAPSSRGREQMEDADRLRRAEGEVEPAHRAVAPAPSQRAAARRVASGQHLGETRRRPPGRRVRAPRSPARPTARVTRRPPGPSTSARPGTRSAEVVVDARRPGRRASSAPAIGQTAPPRG